MLSQKHSSHSAAAEAENMKSINSIDAYGETVGDVRFNEQTGVEMCSKSKLRGKSKLD